MAHATQDPTPPATSPGDLINPGLVMGGSNGDDNLREAGGRRGRRPESSRLHRLIGVRCYPGRRRAPAKRERNGPLLALLLVQDRDEGSHVVPVLTATLLIDWTQPARRLRRRLRCERAALFTSAKWRRIRETLEGDPARYGLPQREYGSVLVGSFNIRKLGSARSRSADTWEFLAEVYRSFDLLAVQEVMDDLSGLRRLMGLLGPEFGMVWSPSPELMESHSRGHQTTHLTSAELSADLPRSLRCPIATPWRSAGSSSPRPPLLTAGGHARPPAPSVSAGPAASRPCCCLTAEGRACGPSSGRRDAPSAARPIRAALQDGLVSSRHGHWQAAGR